MKFDSKREVKLLHGGTTLCDAWLYYCEENNSDEFVSAVMDISLSTISSSRIHPLTALHAAKREGLLFRIQPKLVSSEYIIDLETIHRTCLEELKTAVAKLENGREIQLVAMASESKYRGPSFWAYPATSQEYSSCLSLLNSRYLAVVFDLDETLIVANTNRSFEDKINNLQRRIQDEHDPERVSALTAEKRRYEEDRALLWHYHETDQGIDGQGVVPAKMELIPAADSELQFQRPVVRLQNRNIILTRIDPKIRDTSVLVRFRQSWDHLRKYLVAKTRRRFEVFVCTMAEKQYALEMWRLLDPGNKLIPLQEVKDRIICVKSSLKKSLATVLASKAYPPSMAMIVDDRLDVWREEDQPRVHVLPQFVPYLNPNAEASFSQPVLCMVRSVACNIRANFYREVEEVISPQMSAANYDTDDSSLPSPADVSTYVQMPLIEEELANPEKSEEMKPETTQPFPSAEQESMAEVPTKASVEPAPQPGFVPASLPGPAMAEISAKLSNELASQLHSGGPISEAFLAALFARLGVSEGSGKDLLPAASLLQKLLTNPSPLNMAEFLSYFKIDSANALPDLRSLFPVGPGQPASETATLPAENTPNLGQTVAASEARVDVQSQASKLAIQAAISKLEEASSAKQDLPAAAAAAKKQRREENELPDIDLDAERRRQLIMMHGADEKRDGKAAEGGSLAEAGSSEPQRALSKEGHKTVTLSEFQRSGGARRAPSVRDFLRSLPASAVQARPALLPAKRSLNDFSHGNAAMANGQRGPYAGEERKPARNFRDQLADLGLSTGSVLGSPREPVQRPQLRGVGVQRGRGPLMPFGYRLPSEQPGFGSRLKQSENQGQTYLPRGRFPRGPRG